MHVVIDRPHEFKPSSLALFHNLCWDSLAEVDVFNLLDSLSPVHVRSKLHEGMVKVKDNFFKSHGTRRDSFQVWSEDTTHFLSHRIGHVDTTEEYGVFCHGRGIDSHTGHGLACLNRGINAHTPASLF